MPDLKDYRDVTPALFSQIRREAAPAVLRAQVAHWPAVHMAQRSDEAVIDYINGHDTGEPAGVYVAPPQAHGRLFYGMDTQSYNFSHGPAPIPQILAEILKARDNPHPQGISLQSAIISKHMPGFGVENHLDILPNVEPRIWIGNGVVTRAHNDLNYNVACVVAGQRRFHLFPPEQVVNLYPGPFDRTIGGVPVSMVDIENPDLERHPRFAEAQAQMTTVELEPGDALYIPYGWWHQVHSLSPVNVMVNYWWNEATQPAAPYEALYHAMLAIRDLPEDQRGLWKAMFDYYIFGSHGDPTAHLRPHDKGVLGDLTPGLIRRLKTAIVRALS
ncbi:cupin-like domain-containing protein [Asticcacaulis sp. SL142]|uniref:cupin-like domain-containing protein n=1 Tax=Asticcacaulis sp. SL142 TaxID=2995155 RepID=UPI00226C65EA|nr:cupin-like domain-containing protein [Asticcacaulis sp. SL142]WAC46791.1 cupin-like domain-containing protein [Asticcacaulis sp. SL142]